MIQYINRVVDILVCVEKGDSDGTGGGQHKRVRIELVPWIEILKEKLDVVDETMKHPGGEQKVG